MSEYYLTSAETAILRNNSEDFAKRIPTGSIIVELGSGFVHKRNLSANLMIQHANTLFRDLRKVSILLQALEALGKSIDYYALDLSHSELERTLSAVPKFQYVKCHGLHGTYDDGLEWLKRPEVASKSKCVMHLGSSIGNFDRTEASAFLKSFVAVLQDGDSMLIGLDACNDPAKV